MKVQLTGNPFVDTGLAALAALADCHNIEDLTLEDMREVHGDGKRLARWNSQLKNVSMIFTVNSLATHPQIKDPERRILYYSKMITNILNRIGKEDMKQRCESCGNDRSLDIDNLAREILVPLGYKDAKRYVGRDWFPLAGSMGSDAQSLPAGSRAPNICAKCLFAVHYLPLGTFLVDGMLVVFQSTSRKFWYGLAKSTVENIRERVTAGKVDTLGSKAGSIVAIRTLVEYLNEMKREKLKPGTSLFMWRFSNSGTGADLKIDEIPNPALVFLKRCTEHGLKNEVSDLVTRQKGGDSLLQCISLGRDYYLLYPYKKLNGVSPELFQLYQVYVRKVSMARLKTASAIAEYIKANVTGKDLEMLSKDTEKYLAKQNVIKKRIVEMVDTRKLKNDEYTTLFAKPGTVTSVDYDAWKFIRYYLRNKPQFLEDDVLATVLPFDPVAYIGAVIFTSIIQQKGIEKFRRTVLERLTHGKIGTPWLRNQFTKNATSHQGFTYADWKKLCVNESGKEVPYELLFRLRLMWTEWVATGFQPHEVQPIQQYADSGLPSEYENMLVAIMTDFISKKSIEKFKIRILDELQSGEKGLNWISSKLLSFANMRPEDLEQFFTDDRGNSIRYLRLFQMHLFLANKYREQTFKQHEEIMAR